MYHAAAPMHDLHYKFTRKHAGKEYKFYLMVPSCGLDRKDPENYGVWVETPKNRFGNTDIILLSSVDRHAVTFYRCLPPYILRALEKQMKKLLSDAQRSLRA